MDVNFWENMTFLLAGVVIAGISAAVAQTINIRMLTGGQTRLRVCVKKASDNGSRDPEAGHH